MPWPACYVYAWRVLLKSTSAEALAAGFCCRLCVSRPPKALLSNLETGVAYGVAGAAWHDTDDAGWSAPVFRIVP